MHTRTQQERADYDPEEYALLLEEQWPIEDTGSPLCSAYCATCQGPTEQELVEDAVFVRWVCAVCGDVVAEDAPVTF